MNEIPILKTKFDYDNSRFHYYPFQTHVNQLRAIQRFAYLFYSVFIGCNLLKYTERTIIELTVESAKLSSEPYPIRQKSAVREQS